MAAYEVLLLNTAIPQIQAAQTGDTYVVPRDIAFSAALTLSAGTANGVPYLNGSKVVTTGSALTFDGTVVNNTGLAPNIRATLTGGTVYTSLASDGVYATGTDLYLLAPAGKFISFYADNAEKMRLSGATGGVGALGIGYTSLTSVGDSGLAVLGNVGIGTNAPTGFLANKLVVATGGTANEGITIYSSSNNGSLWFADATTGTGRYAGGIDYQHSTNELIFYSNAQGNMRLDASGNLGLGVTPSAWGSTYRASQIGLSSSLVGITNDTQTHLTTNGYFNGTNWVYIANSPASRYMQDNNSHKWYNAPSGTAGATTSITSGAAYSVTTLGSTTLGQWQAFFSALTGIPSIGQTVTATATGTLAGGATVTQIAVFTQAMTLDASGNLLVGTTSAPPAGYKSHIFGGLYLGNTGGMLLDNGGSVLSKNASGTSRQLVTMDGSNNLSLGGTVDGGIIFYTSLGNERARITSGGDLLVGTQTSGGKLSVVGTSVSSPLGYFRDEGTPTGNLFVVSSNAYGTSIAVNSSGSVVSNTTYSTTVGGTNRDVYVDDTGLLGYVSSIRASKTNIQNISDVSWLLQLNPVSFNYRKKDDKGNYTEETDGPIEYGLIAEDTELVKPELCFYDEADGAQELRGISYSKLITPMLKMLQEQQAMINELKAEVAALKGA